MRYLVVILLMLICGGQVEAQKKYSVKNKKAIKIFEEGAEHLMWENYDAALERFQMALKVEPKFVDCYFAMSDIYREKKDYKSQFEVLTAGIAIDSTYYPMAYYSAGVALCQMGDTSSLRYFDLYRRYANPKRMRKDVEYWVKHAKFVKNMMDNPVPFNPRRVSENLTSEFDLYWPSLTIDEKEIVLTTLVPKHIEDYRRYPDMPKSTIYYQEDFTMAQRDDSGEWGILKDVPDINTRLTNEGAQALSPDGMWMFLTICGRQDSKGSCDIYFSRRTSTGWTSPRNIGAPVNSQAWESQPCLSADGQTLYFVSGRGGGKGGHDIWRAKIKEFREDGFPIFGPVENLGDSINTSGDEASPFIHPDNRTLYFSSNGWEGMGSMDIFVSRRDNDTAEWKTPVNIGYPINTNQDEIGLVISTAGNVGYYSSDIMQADGRLKKELLCFDIPVKHRPNVVSYLKGKVYDIETRYPLSAQLELLDLSSGKKVTLTESRASDGSFLLNLPSGRNYALIASKDKYLYHSETFALEKAEERGGAVYLDMPMTPIRVGAKITLKNVFFEFDSRELKPESVVELTRLVALMNDNPSITVEIGGHTDNYGSEAYNANLSMARAKSTVAFLISKGISEKRLKAKGYGSKQPIGDNGTEEGRALNRRIEAKIIE
ncbi:MAG: OmpA family protein [Bacteroidia bacterium]|nr:OmpA family protein [Bacteroidia bacterium]